MKFKTGLIIFFLALVFAPGALAQDVSQPLERVAKLHLELMDVQAKEVVLRIRLEELTEALKPENIERALAGIGSTKPEELREHRRRLLTLERDGVLAQLKVYEVNRQRLEVAIATADSVVYPLSPQPSPAPSSNKLTLSGNVATGRLRLAALGLGLVTVLIMGGAWLVTVRSESSAA